MDIGVSFKNIKIKSINKKRIDENEKRFLSKKRQRKCSPLVLAWISYAKVLVTVIF